MKIDSIRIVFEDEEHTEETKELSVFSRRIIAEFKDGQWIIDGPIILESYLLYMRSGRD